MQQGQPEGAIMRWNANETEKKLGSKIIEQLPVSNTVSQTDTMCQENFFHGSSQQRHIPPPARNYRVSLPGKNRLEQRYAKYLDHRVLAGEILSYKYESIKFKLSTNTTYTPDFLVIHPSELQIHEVKGFWEDDARVKIKWFTDLYPFFRIYGVTLTNNQWKFEEFTPTM
jgi:hypothetical protein